MSNKVSSSEYTNTGGAEYNQTAAYGDPTLYPNQWQISNLNTEGATGEEETTYQCDWTKWHGCYREVPLINSIIDKKAMWVVGNGFKINGSKESQDRIKRIKGIGKDSFNSIMQNAVRTYTICGDFFAEIIKDAKGRLINLKPLNPGSVIIIVNKFGMIKRYDQVVNIGNNKMITSFKPENIFHLSWNRIADEIHGISTLQKLVVAISTSQELEKDMKVIFHRYAKPLLITEVDTDDPAEIAAFKAKLDASVEKGENMIIPKGIANVERVSIPQYSTLDPLPYLKAIERLFIIAEGVPKIILGNSSEEDTEASSKIVYLAFEQMVKYNQLFLEDQIRNQLGIEIKFEFPASIAPSLLEDNKKDGQNMSPDKIDPSKRQD